MKLTIKANLLVDLDNYIERTYKKAYNDWQRKQKAADTAYAKLKKSVINYLMKYKEKTKREAEAQWYGMHYSEFKNYWSDDAIERQVEQVEQLQTEAEQAKQIAQTVNSCRGHIS